ncbi:MAG: formylglycine-generating enzyme family protein, partial [Acidobacteriota bacterium]|nr:formylglycine-generating enzyme family protein [Acidobacteriota bacterium]
MPSTSELRQDLALARAHTDELFQLLDPAAMYDRPIPERHRIIFYLGHLEAFDWNQIARLELDTPSFHPKFDQLFEAGIDPEPGKAPADKPSDWPKLREVADYKNRVRETVDGLWDNASPDVRQMAIEHREMHAETFCYMLHNLEHEKKRDKNAARASDTVAEATGHRPEMISIPSGDAILGKRTGDGFGWDNEFQQVIRNVPAFAIGKYKITNGEYLEFVNEGAAARHYVPHYWVRRDGNWFYRGMFEEIPLPLDWPVYVSRQEAAAYAEWKGKSLPTEAQFQRAAYGTARGTPDGTTNGTPATARGNFDYERWEPVPVNGSPESDSAFGVSQLVGNGWEATSTVFAPFEGFAPSPTYPGYSANFFDNSHYVVKGASPRTSSRLVRPSFRNWFR